MNLGRLGRHAEATELFKHALHCTEQALGPEHPDTLRCSGNLAFSLGEQGQHAEAAQCLQRTLDATQRVQGRDHADMHATLWMCCWASWGGRPAGSPMHA